MQYDWSLNEMYAGLDDPAFQQDCKQIPLQIAKMNAYAQASFADTTQAATKIEAFIGLLIELGALTKVQDFLELLLATNTTHPEAGKYLDQVEGEFAKLSASNTYFMEFVAKIPNLDALIAQSPLLQIHAFFLHEQVQQSTHRASGAEEELLSRLRTTGSTAWGKQFELLTSTLQVEIDLPEQPPQLTLQAVRNLAYSTDPVVRKTAYYAEQQGYTKVDKALTGSINAIKGEAITTAELHKYQSVLDMTLTESRMDSQTLDAMWAEIRESLPVFRTYLKRKAELLEHTNGLPFYDLFAPVGEADLTYTYQQAQAKVIETFSDFNPAMGAFARNAFEKHWIDVYPKDGKRGGAFCHSIHPIKESRILANFSDSFDGVLTLGHELGHAYHSHCLKDETILNSDYSMPIAETASTFCETLMVHAELKTATPQQSLSVLETYLCGLSQVIVDIYGRFLFEDELIARRAQGPLALEEIKELHLKSQREAYGDALDHSFLHPYVWANKPHYYRAQTNYYNFPYAYGQLFALGLYAQYQKEGDSFLPKYDALLAATGKNDLYTVGMLAGINVRDRAFWKSSLALAAQDIDRFIALSK